MGLVEAHTRTGREVEDPKFPLKMLTYCAITEWFLLIIVPGLELTTFWDTLGELCCPPPRPLQAGGEKDASTEKEEEESGLISSGTGRELVQTVGRCSRD